MQSYKKIVRHILDNGEVKENRTGVNTIAVAGMMFEHDMSEGFPLLTTKFVPFKTMAVELEGFIKGITDKKWFQERNCKIWNEWCNPTKVPYSHHPAVKMKMMEENDLGPIYGYQWSSFNKKYKPIPHIHTNFDKRIEVINKDAHELVGKEETNNAGFKFTVIKFSGRDDYGRALFDIKFHNSGFILKNVRSDAIKMGMVKDVYSPTVNGVACIGEILTTKDQITKNLYKVWIHMIDRCYNKSCKDYKYYGQEGVYVSDEWLIFKNFYDEVQFLFGWNEKKENLTEYHLDKDLSKKGYYSKDTCIWLHKSENIANTRKLRKSKATSPDGKEFIFYNSSKFSKEHNLCVSKVNAVLRGYRKHHKKWKFEILEQCEKKEEVNQLKNVVDTLKTNPDDRRMIVSSWNPQQIPQMALPPCHYSWQVIVINEKLNLTFTMRSCDVALGLPFNIASYGLLLLLLCKQSGFKPGKLIGFLGDTHIYKNHIDGLVEQMQRDIFMLPFVKIEKFRSIFDWQYTDAELLGYEHHPAIKFEIAV